LLDVSPLIAVLMAVMVLMLVASLPARRDVVRPAYSGGEGCQSEDCDMVSYTLVVPAHGAPYVRERCDIPVEPWDTLEQRLLHGRRDLVVGWQVIPESSVSMQSVIRAVDRLGREHPGSVALDDSYYDPFPGARCR
jgi:hypothetical protein